jgi:hypothetical protein
MIGPAKSAIRRVGKRLIDARWRRLESQMNFPPEAALVVCGDPRGGSTWLSELIGSIPAVSTLWEPLHIVEVPEFKALGFGWRHHIEAGSEDLQARQLFERLFRGQLLNSWLCMRTTASELHHAKRLQVKFCRANQLLPWLTEQFSFERMPIHLVRHPCAVVASQLKYGGWNDVPKQASAEMFRENPLMRKFQMQFEKVDNQIKWLAAMWCACNSVPLNSTRSGQSWMTVSYESLLLDPDLELSKIFERWGMEQAQIAEVSSRRISKTTLETSPIATGNVHNQLVYWKQVLSEDQVRDVLSMLDLFEVGIYSADELPINAQLM